MVYIKVIGEFKAVHIAEDNEQGERHRRVLHPHQDVSNETDEIKNICNAEWTDEVKTAWQNKLIADKELSEVGQ